ncbi:diacylglycerol kinase [Brumimicrobium salinarum]|uniref:Diacylglycerol kinase n=1 Tax=Brumimicrobium salinarum TaxID=2058658 RepID=A0A2I0R466_9FLAO|nr:diacylglycerol kinase family protein [Brumimicrobium salinarum]PKR81374.1 diacylglycerol kinase [Brumimicrobium salinarum]
MKKIEHILFVVNPIAGDNDKTELIHLVEKSLEERKIKLTIYKTTGVNDQEQIQQKVKENDFDCIFVAGGDGTIKIVAEGVLNEDVPLALFPSGSANGFALNFDIPETPQEQLEVALNGKVEHIDVLKINDHISLHLADFGVNADLIKNYDKSQLRGKMGYLMQSIPTLMKSEHPYTFKIVSEETSKTVEASVLSIANCQKYGTGACINPQGKTNDGQFEIIAFKNLNLIEIIKTFTDQIDLNPDFAEVLSVKSAEVFCEHAVSFQIDGEYLGKLKNVKVKLLNQAIPLMVPTFYSS